MTYLAPCQSPENDPDDWYISSDGKQYTDDKFVTDEEVREYLAQEQLPDDDFEKVKRRTEVDAKRDALQRRRHAAEKCQTCYFRTSCLDIALQPMTPATHGTWGGYNEEQLRAIRRERDERRNP